MDNRVKQYRSVLLYTGKLLHGKTFVVFTVFLLNCECFPTNHGHVDQQYKSTECYSESFTMNSYFPLRTQNFSYMKVFPYTVYCVQVYCNILQCGLWCKDISYGSMASRAVYNHWTGLLVSIHSHTYVR